MKNSNEESSGRSPERPTFLRPYQEEFERVLIAIKHNTLADHAKKKHPLNKTTEIIALLGEEDSSYRINDCIRKIHDFYGWLAKNAGRLFGGCSGCLYRTSDFLNLDPELRDGSRNETRNIHVEHLVPVKMLVAHVQKNRDLKPHQLLASIIESSICVAMSYQEQLLLDQTSVPRSWSPSTSIEFLPDDRPFLRYESMWSSSDKSADFRVYDMVQKHYIDMNTFTFRDHRNNISSLFETPA